MRSIHLLYYIVIPLLMSIFIPASTDDNKKWVCISNKFCRIAEEPQNLTLITFQSQEDCRLSCGKYGAIWPMPTGDCILGDERVHFEPFSLHFNVTAPTVESTNFILEAKDILIQNLLKECIRSCTLANSTGTYIQVNVTVNSNRLDLGLDTDESYILNVTTVDHTTAIKISAETIFGARHGLETLSNLAANSMEDDLLLVSSANISDRPKFAHRGLLLDTSRNFFSVYYIRKTLDAMAASKLNVFHWHATDSHSFPLEIPGFPEMTRTGAYSSKHIYHRADIQNIVKYALVRGIRVLFEIDGPSHAGNGWQWGPERGLGDLAVCVNKTPYKSYCIQPPCGQLNPINNNTYMVMKSIYQYLAELLPPDEIMHMGGDEVNFGCWNSIPEIKSAMIDKGHNLWSDFHRRTLEAYDQVMNNLSHRHTNASKDVIIWSSALTDRIELIEKYLPKERYIIQVWNTNPKATEILRAKGYRTIISNKWAWYLDHGARVGTYHDWSVMYNHRIDRSPLTLGGEVCLWSEMFDEKTFEIRIWPRAGAAAERLWSDPETRHGEAQFRFNRYRERLITLGCKTQVVTEKWCALNEGLCV